MTEDLDRYHRQMLLPGFGEEGQRRLLNSTVLIMGCGALGTVAADMLARAGVGHLKIIDRDFIELTNLQRQVLFDERDVRHEIPKAEAAKRKIALSNSQVEVTAIVDDLNYNNIEQYAEGVDLLIDGLDNFETRYLANDFAVKNGIPYLYGGAVSTVGMAFPVLPHTAGGDAPWEKEGLATACYRCIFEEAPSPGQTPTCDTVGVLGSMVAIIANFQVAEALKILTGNYASVSRTVLSIDVWANTISQLKVEGLREQGDCQCCKQGNFEYLDGKMGSDAESLCGRDAVQLRHRQSTDGVDLAGIARKLEHHGKVRSNDFMIRADIAEGDHEYELTLFADGRAIVKGTAEASVARSVYSKYVGN